MVVGASSGGVEALSALLPTLPKHMPWPVVVVVHVPADKESIMAKLFDPKCEMKVKEAEDKEALKHGTIYFAPPGYHLLVEQSKSLSLSTEEAILFSRPSIDVLFETAADAYGMGTIGIILSGANNDGAAGLKAIAKAGGTTIVQAPETARAAMMPLAAIEACPESFVLNLEQIALYLKAVM